MGRVQERTWDGVLLDDPMLAPHGLVARRAAKHQLRYEVLPLEGLARRAAADPRLRFEGLPTDDPRHPTLPTSLYGQFSPRLGCGVDRGRLDLAGLCLARA